MRCLCENNRAFLTEACDCEFKPKKKRTKSKKKVVRLSGPEMKKLKQLLTKCASLAEKKIMISLELEIADTERLALQNKCTHEYKGQ